MGFDKDSAKAARDQQIADKEKSDKALNDHLEHARHTKKLYGYDFTQITETFKIKKYQHRNYPTPNKANLNPSKPNKRFRFKQGRGQQMVSTALAAIKK